MFKLHIPKETNYEIKKKRITSSLVTENDVG